MNALWAVLAITLSQGQAPDSNSAIKVSLGPTVPAGSHAFFQQTCLEVQEQLEKGDFAAAAKVASGLPKLSFTLAWDETNVPANLRAGYRDARDRAVSSWMKGYPNCEITVIPYRKATSPVPDVVIGFTDRLPQKAEDPIPPGAVHFLSHDPSEPRVEAVISLKRGAPPTTSDVVDIHNEVAYAMMQYYGVERSITFGSFSARSEVSVVALSRPGMGERAQVGDNLRVADSLRASVAKKERLIPARPRIQLEPAAWEGGQRNQGEVVKFGIQVTNLGNAPLNLRTVPDCTCVASLKVATLAPGETRLIPAQINLIDVTGEFDRSIMIYSNDLEKTTTRMPVRVFSKPVYRLLPEDDGLVLMPPGGAKVKVYLTVPEGIDLKPLATRMDGLEADISFRPWSGSLADPGMNEPAMPRKGYVFDVNIADQLPPGRTRASFLVLTNHPIFKEIETIISVQKGIVGLPDYVNMGEIAPAPRRSIFLLSRPKKNFQIRSVSVDSPFLTVSHEAIRDQWEHRFTVQFDGRAAPGPLRATITIQTSDPVQPTIRIPYSAMVK